MREYCILIIKYFSAKYYFCLIVIAGFYFSSTLNVKGQDVPYSQFVASGIYLNPALVGSNICPRVKLFHREQWTSIPRAYSNTHVMFDWHSYRIDSGLGFSYKNDSQGDGLLQSHHIRASYSKPIKLSDRWSMRAGIYAAYALRQLNWNKLEFVDQLDPNHGFIHNTQVLTPEETNIHYPDFGSGITFNYNNKLYTGFSINRLFRPEINYYDHMSERLNMKFSGHLGYVIPLTDNWQHDRDWEKNATLTPNILFEKQGYFYQVTGGFYFSRDPVFAGVWARHAFENMDAIVFNLGFQQPKYKVGYSYDFTISPLTARSSGGSHEISLTWYLSCPEPPDTRYQPMDCPCPPSFLK